MKRHGRGHDGESIAPVDSIRTGCDATVSQELMRLFEMPGCVVTCCSSLQSVEVLLKPELLNHNGSALCVFQVVPLYCWMILCALGATALGDEFTEDLAH